MATTAAAGWGGGAGAGGPRRRLEGAAAGARGGCLDAEGPPREVADPPARGRGLARGGLGLSIDGSASRVRRQNRRASPRRDLNDGRARETFSQGYGNLGGCCVQRITFGGGEPHANVRERKRSFGLRLLAVRALRAWDGFRVVCASNTIEMPDGERIKRHVPASWCHELRDTNGEDVVRKRQV